MSVATLREALAGQGGTLATVLRAHDDLPGDPGPDAGEDPAAGVGAHARTGEERRAAADGASESAPGIGAPQAAARGPRAAGHEADYELLLEMILEGSLLHYGRPRVVGTEDRDLALLLGDQLYALGLARLAELGDLDSVRELADIISLLSQAEHGADPGLARAVWAAGARAIGWGPSPEHEAAKALARAGDASASAALLQSAGRGVPGGPSEQSAD